MRAAPGLANRLGSGRAGQAGTTAGMTVVELMIAVVILGVVTAAAFSVAFSIMNSYREHRRSTGVERSARGAIDVLSEAVRNSNPGSPTGEIIDLIACEPATGIRVDNRSDGPDALHVVYASGGIVTSTRAPFTETSTQIIIEDGSNLVAGDHILITDLTRGHLVAILSIAQAGPDWIITLKEQPVNLCPPPALPVAAFEYPSRTTVLRVQKARFAIETAGGIPVLTMDVDGPSGVPGEAVAEGVEDLQIAIGVDRDGDGALTETGAVGDDDDWVYNHPDDTLLPPIGVTPYRALRLTLTARTVDDTTTTATSTRQQAEDRAAGVAPDAFRRRNLSTVVEIRNLRGSP